MNKPKVRIKNWGIYRYERRSGDKPWALYGVVIDHPRFEPNTSVTTSSILEPSEAELSNLHAGDQVETRNTVYILVGEHENGTVASSGLIK